MNLTRLRPPGIAEIIFDIAYLVFAAVAGLYIITKASGAAAVLYGAMTLVLGFGDAFHLIPRVYSLWTDTMEKSVRILGFGKLVTSITMTIFYVMLYFVWKLLFGGDAPSWFTILVLLLAAVRILLCLLPGNKWMEPNPPLCYAIYRNIPFAFLGLFVILLFVWRHNTAFYWMPLSIALSFGFYFAVVLFAGRYKAAGALMLPKTCAYVCMVCMGFSLISK